MSNNYWNTFKPELQNYGFIIDDNFINELSNRNHTYIQSQIKNIPSITYTKHTHNNDIAFISVNDTHKFTIDKYINKGRHNHIYLISNQTNNQNNQINNQTNNQNNQIKEQYIYRLSLYVNLPNSRIIDNFIESFFIAFFSIYQKIILIKKNKNYFVSLLHLCYNKQHSFISSISQKMDGTLAQLLSNQTFSIDERLNILIRALNQLTRILKHLQKHMKFVHNDFKSDNIFYKIKNNNCDNLFDPLNLDFYISDFDSTQIEINNVKIIGNIFFSSNTCFNPKKDLFLLIHSIYFFLHCSEWKNKFFNFFPIIDNIVGSEKNFHLLYKMTDINDIYLPDNLYKHIKKL
jgi:hypothetical protein